jgi:hypothetical protein
VQVTTEQLDTIRPLNDLWLKGTADRIAQAGPNRAGIDPRLMAFLAQTSAIGLLTLKGSVEALDDPLLYSDEDLVAALAAIFSVAAAPAGS